MISAPTTKNIIKALYSALTIIFFVGGKKEVYPMLYTFGK